MDSAVRRRPLCGSPYASRGRDRVLEQLAHEINAFALRHLPQELELVVRRKLDTTGKSEGQLRCIRPWNVHIAPGELPETIEETQGPFDRGRRGGIFVVLYRRDLSGVEAPASRKLEQPEASAALDEYVHPPIRHSSEHLGNPCACADVANSLVVGEDEPELVTRVEALADELLVSLLEDVQRDALCREQHERQRKQAELGHAPRLSVAHCQNAFRSPSRTWIPSASAAANNVAGR